MAQSANKVGYVSVANSFAVGDQGRVEDVAQYAHAAVTVSLPPGVTATVRVTFSTGFDAEEDNAVSLERSVTGGDATCLQGFEVQSQCMRVQLTAVDPDTQGVVQTVLHKHKSRPQAGVVGGAIGDFTPADVQQCVLYTKNDYGGYNPVPTAPGGFGACVSLPLNFLPSIYAAAVDVSNDLNSSYHHGDVTVSYSGVTLSDGSGLLSKRAVRHNGAFKVLAAFQVKSNSSQAYGASGKIGVCTNTCFAYFNLGVDSQVALGLDADGQRAQYALVLDCAPTAAGTITLTLELESLVVDVSAGDDVSSVTTRVAGNAALNGWVATSDGVATVTFSSFDFKSVQPASLQVTSTAGVQAHWVTLNQGRAASTEVLQISAQWNKNVQVGPASSFQICLDGGVVHFAMQDISDGAFVVLQTLRLNSSVDGCRLKAAIDSGELALTKFTLATEGPTKLEAFYQRHIHASYANITLRGGQVTNLMSIMNSPNSSSDVTVLKPTMYASLLSSCLLHIISNATLSPEVVWRANTAGSNNLVYSCANMCAVRNGVIVHTVVLNCTSTTNFPALPLGVGEHLTFACEPLASQNLVSSDICISLAVC